MPLWTNVDEEAGKPKDLSVADKAQTYGVDVAEAGVTPVTYPGWVKHVLGTGPIVSVSIDVAGSGFTDGTPSVDAVTIGAPPAGGVQATATVDVVSGEITVVNITEAGSGYTSAPTISVATGTGETLTAVMGGRVGRVNSETLVAMKTITGDAEDVIFPDT